MKPFLRWAGGKNQILHYIKEIVDVHFDEQHTFIEPFVGGGSVFLSFQFQNIIINDLNFELINAYRVVKNNLEELISLLAQMEESHQKSLDGSFYYQVRAWDREEDYEIKKSSVERAARLIYLNKTCFNGLYRVNTRGFFNTPIGKPITRKILDTDKLSSVSDYLKKNKIKTYSSDFEKIAYKAKPGDFVYFDPPYDYDEKGFTQYVSSTSNPYSLERLKKVVEKLTKKGTHILISNNDTFKVREIFNPNQYEYNEIEVQRLIGSKCNSRKKVKEVLIFGRGLK